MGSLLSNTFGFDPITKADLNELGFKPHKPIDTIFGEPYSFIKTVSIESGSRFDIKYYTAFRFIVTFPKDGDDPGDPVIVLTLKDFTTNWEWDNKNAIVELAADLATLKSMLTEEYLKNLITKIEEK